MKDEGAWPEQILRYCTALRPSGAPVVAGCAGVTRGRAPGHRRVLTVC
jgi:hypothetical protein